ncbi:hypothetical protein BVU76_01475 [Mycolicibacterium porcinum]|nr:hypothetical protein BVU76_01475 [Mycolicibacterium porcinum]
MHASLRPFTTAGIALVGAGILAATPVIAPPVPPDIQVPRVATTQVGLTAEADFLARWVEVFNTASDNATTLADVSFEAPATALQQVIVNQVGYMGDVLNDPASIGTVFETIGGNLEKAFSWATMQGLPDDINDPGLVPVLALSNDAVHTLIVALLPTFLPEGTPEFVTPLVHFLASPLSGVLIGFAGPLVSPGVAALNSIMAGDLLNLPANVVDGFLNGATLNLDVLLPVINGAGVLPEGTTFDKLGIAFGGLLSPGATVNTVPVGPMVGEPGIGGSIFSSLDLAITTNALGFPFTLKAPGVPVGPIGALASLSQIVAGAIGWDGDGNPLTHLTFPKIETEPNTATPSTLSALGTKDQPAALPSPSSASPETVPNTALVEESSSPADGVDAERIGRDESKTGANSLNSSAGATDLTNGNKAVPGKAGTSSTRAGQQLRTAAQDTAKRVKQGFTAVQKRVESGLKSVSGGADTSSPTAGDTTD